MGRVIETAGVQPSRSELRLLDCRKRQGILTVKSVALGAGFRPQQPFGFS